MCPLATVRQFVADPMVQWQASLPRQWRLRNDQWPHLRGDMSALQQPRLKTSSRAVPSTMPTMEQTMPRPTATSNPTSPPEERPTSHNGATGTCDHVQSISSGSTSSQATVSSETMLDIEQLMWEKLVIPQCTPLFWQQLDDTDYYPLDNQPATLSQSTETASSLHIGTTTRRSTFGGLGSQTHNSNSSNSMEQCMTL
eukprot:6333704-Amphidinium_carterae.2